MNSRYLFDTNIVVALLKSGRSRTSELLGLKQILADFFVRKAVSEVDQIWDQQNLSDEVMDSWLDEG